MQVVVEAMRTMYKLNVIVQKCCFFKKHSFSSLVIVFLKYTCLISGTLTMILRKRPMIWLSQLLFSQHRILKRAQFFREC